MLQQKICVSYLDFNPFFNNYIQVTCKILYQNTLMLLITCSLLVKFREYSAGENF